MYLTLTKNESSCLFLKWLRSLAFAKIYCYFYLFLSFSVLHVSTSLLHLDQSDLGFFLNNCQCFEYKLERFCRDVKINLTSSNDFGLFRYFWSSVEQKLLSLTCCCAVFLCSLAGSHPFISPLPHFPGWIDVTWDAGGSNSYRMGAEGKFDLKLAPGYDPESAPSPKPVSSTVAGTPQSWSSLVKNNCPDKGGSSSTAGASSSSRKGSSSSVCSVASSSDISLSSTRVDRRVESLLEQGVGIVGGPPGAEGQEPIVVLSTAEAGSASSTSTLTADTGSEIDERKIPAPDGTSRQSAESTAISMGIVSVSSPDVSSVSESSSKEAASQRPLCSVNSARLSVSSLLAAGAPMSSSASVPNLSSREASLMESFVRRAPNMSRTNATNNMNLSRSSSDNNTNTLGRNVLSTASEYLLATHFSNSQY